MRGLRRLALALSLVPLVAGCRETPPSPPRAETAAPVVDLRTDGDAAAQRGDWATAAARYAAALRDAPDDVLLHFALGSALSQLDRGLDAAEQFTWVIEHGEPSRPEVSTAREWLRQAGLLGDSSRPADPVASFADERAKATAAAREVGIGAVTGRTSWPGLEPKDGHVAVRVRLRPDDESTVDTRLAVSVRLGAPFKLPKVPAGRYRLVGESRGLDVWDVPVVVERNKTTTVDLSPGNSAVRPAEFPPSS